MLSLIITLGDAKQDNASGGAEVPVSLSVNLTRKLLNAGLSPRKIARDLTLYRPGRS